VLADYLSQGGVNEPGTFTDSKTRAAYFEQVAYIVGESEVRHFVMSMYPFVLVTRFFKAFSAQPRLALVTATFTTVAADMAHFGFVFVCIFGLFVASAVILFGQDLKGFSTFDRAADSTFHVLLGTLIGTL